MDADRAVGAADADVDVDPEAVVAPDDVAEELVVPPVVRRVDDPLLLPRAHGCVPVAPSAIPSPSADARELLAALAHARRRRGRTPRSGPSSPRPPRRSARRRGAARGRCRGAAACSSSKRFTSPSVSGSRSANSSSTATVKSVPASKPSRATADQLVGAQPLLVAHRGPMYSNGATGDGRRSPSSSARRWRGAPPRRAAGAPPARVPAGAARACPQVVRRPPCERSRAAVLGRILLLEALGDLGEPGMARDERRRARGGRLRGDHPERLREDRRHHGHVREREQLDEVAVLERPGEERPRRRERLQLRRCSRRSRRSRRARRGRRAPPAGRGRPCCRGACRSTRPSARRPRGTPQVGRRCPRRAAAPRCSPGSARRGAPRRASAPSASPRGRGRKSSTSTPGGTS